MLSRNQNLRTSVSSKDKKPGSVGEILNSFTMIGLSMTSSIKLEDSVTEIVGTPNIKVTGTTVVFDYNINPIAMNAFFDNFVPGTTFTLTNGAYDWKTYNLDGGYTFDKKINNLVIATSGTLSNVIDQVYLANHFDATPIITKNVAVYTALEKNVFLLTNTLHSAANSFSINKVVVNSIIEIDNVKYKVLSISSVPFKEKLIITYTNTDEIIDVISFSITEPQIINLYSTTNDQSGTSSSNITTSASNISY